MKFTVAVGDKVAYSVQFLKSIGMSHSDIAHWRGIVTEVQTLSPQLDLAIVDWGHDGPNRINVQNLAKVGPNRRFCNVD